VPDGSTSAVLTSAIAALLEGPNADDTSAGLTSVFSSASAGLLTSATVAGDGTATLDFDPALTSAIPNASSAAGSDALLRELDATVFQFSPDITAATYTLGGSCDDFFAFIQQTCTPRTPDDGADALFAITYPGPDTVEGTSGNVTEVVLTEDFEAQMTWIIGLRRAAQVTVTTATSPARVIVRVADSAATPATRPTFTG
jgi:hypothetical protein